MIRPYYNQQDRKLMRDKDSFFGASMLLEIAKMKFCRELYKSVRSALNKIL